METVFKGILRGPKEDTATWAGLTTLQKEEAVKRYEKELAEWRKRPDFRGEKVTWPLTVEDVVPDKERDGYILTASSEKGYLVTVRLAERLRSELLKLKRNYLVEVTGTILDYRVDMPKKGLFKDSSNRFGVLLDGVLIKQIQAGNFAVLFNLRVKADDVVYLIDRSGSMVDVFDFVRKELIDSVNALTEQQLFHVIFYSDRRPVENSPQKLVPATSGHKAALREFAIKVRPQGKTNPVPALERAFKELRRAKGKHKVIYLLTDGEFPDNAAVLRAIRRYNRGKTVRVYTFLYGNRLAGAVKVMKTIAKENGGEFMYISAGK